MVARACSVAPRATSFAGFATSSARWVVKAYQIVLQTRMKVSPPMIQSVNAGGRGYLALRIALKRLRDDVTFGQSCEASPYKNSGTTLKEW